MSAPASVMPRVAITIGPVLYWWPRETLLAFYGRVADGPADSVVLGETVCSRRNEMASSDWLDLARDLRSAGKEVVLASQTLLAGEADLRAVRRLAEQDEFAVEAGDASALRLLAQARQSRDTHPPFVIGPHINVYSRAALVEHAALGAGRWVAPVELPLDAVGLVNPPSDRVRSAVGEIETEVFAFGRLPLAFSARCFTARHHRLGKDTCEFRCRDDADGLLLASGEGAPFLALNGIQTQSAAVQSLVGDAGAVHAAGAARIRLSPCSRDFGAVVDAFDAAFNHGVDADAALDALRELDLPGTLVDGYARRRAGIEPARRRP